MTKQTTPKRISDVAPDETSDMEYRRISDIAGIDLTLLDVTFREGDYGEYALMTVVTEASGIPFFVTTGAKPVMRQLRQIDKDDDLPLIIRAVRVGRTWKLE